MENQILCRIAQFHRIATWSIILFYFYSNRGPTDTVIRDCGTRQTQTVKRDSAEGSMFCQGNNNTTVRHRREAFKMRSTIGQSRMGIFPADHRNSHYVTTEWNKQDRDKRRRNSLSQATSFVRWRISDNFASLRGARLYLMPSSRKRTIPRRAEEDYVCMDVDIGGW